MKNIYSSIDNFITILDQASLSLGQFQKNVSNREQKILDLIGALADVVQHSTADKKCERDPLFKEIMRSFSEVSKSIAAWRERVEKVMKDREFIDRFDKALIVMVYGKVKAGKSTLGNFVSGVMLKELPDTPYKGFSPEFMVHESADKAIKVPRLEEIEADGFEVKPTEATNCIQTFTLGGLAWVDTPGIHSMTDANGALAASYVENAELVIYVSSSDSPIRKSDLYELKGLMRQQKPTLIVISKFDTPEEDEDDETGAIISTLVSKGEKAKREQLEWIERQIKQGGLNNLLKHREHAFISVRLALKALQEGDLEKFTASGLPEFYSQLTSILNEDALRLKQQAPKRKVNVLIDELCAGFTHTSEEDAVASVKEWIETFSKHAQNIKSRRKVLLAKNRAFSQIAIARCDTGITDILQKAEQQVSEGHSGIDVSEEISNYLSERLLEVIREELREEMKQNEQSLKDAMGNIHLEGWSLPSLEQRWDSITVSNHHLTEGIGGGFGGAVGTGAGAKGGAALGTLVGGPVGTLVGGLLGAMVGGILGSLVGKGAGSLFTGTKTIRVNAGTNLDELRKDVFNKLNEIAPSVTTEVLQTFVNHWYDPMLKHTNMLLDELGRLEKQLRNLKFKD